MRGSRGFTMAPTIRRAARSRTARAFSRSRPSITGPGDLESLETLEPPISSEGLYLTLAHDSACNDPWLRGQLAKKMTELTAAGLPETLLQRNLERWKAQQLQAADVPPQKQEQSQ